MKYTNFAWLLALISIFYGGSMKKIPKIGGFSGLFLCYYVGFIR